jgi:acyl-CoA oxidase
MTVKFGVQFGLFGGSIHALGTEEHRERYLPKVATLELPGCFAMTETAHGSNVRGLETTITYDAPAAEFVVHTPREAAGKEYIGNALHGRMAAVFGQLIVGGENRGVHAILTPLRDELGRLLPGIRVEDNGYKMGLNGVDNGRIWFDEVRVPREHLLSRFGGVGPDGEYASPIKDPSRRFFTMLGALVGGRVCVPRAGLSAAKSALSIAVRYGLRRRQFGPSYTEPETIIMDYPAHQRRLLPPLAKAYALHFALEGLSERYLRRRPEEMREIETLAAGMKAYTTWFVTATIQECREACGGKGYLAENRFAALKADTDIFTTFEGDNTVLMQLVARGVLSDFRKEFAEEGVWGMLRYLGANFATNILERNPIVIRLTDREHLLGREFHLNAFQYRERRLLSSAAQRLRALIKDGMTAYDAFLRCQTHLLALAEAFVERFVLEKFHEAIGANENEELSPILEKLCQFFALHTIEKNQGWYLGKDYIRANKSRAIRRLIDDLCAEIRPDAGALVEAFDIPRELLGAPIAFEE